MKKITLLLIGFFLSFSVFSQRGTEIFNEDFSSDVPPTGWTIDGMPAQWSQSTTSNAGGTAPEARLLYINAQGTTRLISPETDLTGVSSVLFSFKHFLDDYSASGYTIGVATRSGGGSWTDIWTVNPSGNMGPETNDFLITNADVGTSDFQICIYLSGNMYNFDYWFIDDAVLSEPDTNDATLHSINLLPYAEAGDITIDCTAKNVGLTTINSIDLNYQIDSNTVITENLTGLNLQTTESLNHSFTTPWVATPGDYTLKAWVSNMNGNGDDDDTSNDEKTQNMSIATQSTPNLPLFEEFTSSTCAPCVSFNNIFTPFMDAHPDDIAVIKYQMSWPAPGDPYYTEEGGIRRGYYGVSGVPSLFTGGVSTPANSSGVNSAYANESSRASYFDVASNFEIDGNNIEVDVNIMPYISVNLRVHIVVIEKLTTGNTGSNGETEFKHVMMKMLPDAGGTMVNFSTGVNSNINETFDMSTTFVEEMSDLAVIVFIQDDSTHQVMQAVNATEGGIGVDETSLQSVSIYPNPSNGILNITTDRKIDISIHDILGKFVYSNSIENSKTMDLSHLNSGVYIITVTDGKNQSSQKLVISN